MKKSKFITFFFVATLSIATTAQIPSYIPTDSLVGWWPFNGNANDESGNGNHGTNKGANLTTDRYGNSNNAYYFDGASYIYGNAENFPKNSRTVSLWYMADTLGRQNHRMLLYGYGGGSCGNAWIVNFENPGIGQNWYGKIEIQGHCVAFGSTVDYPVPYKNNWINFTVTYNSSTEIISYYFNGKIKKQLNIGSTTTGTSNRLWVFGSYTDWNTNNIYQGNGDFPFQGKLDDIGIWNRVLDSNEIKALYQMKNCKLTVVQEPQDKGGFNGSIDFTLKTNDSTATYQWQTNQGTGWLNLSNAGQYNGVTTDSLVVKNVTPSNDGQLFRCIAIGNCGKDTTREARLNIWGVNTNQLSLQKLAIHPNPVGQHIQISGLNKSDFEYVIYSIAGRLISKGVSSGTINVSEMNSGLYLLRINGQNVKFIKE